mmetsp:Transcript_23598/g.55914  ORF Transcript_23598/g.55914 Transcript_23598/m.55914 type:complete len:118 (-) Transcript_23598:1130-1483(-)
MIDPGTAVLINKCFKQAFQNWFSVCACVVADAIEKRQRSRSWLLYTNPINHTTDKRMQNLSLGILHTKTISAETTRSNFLLPSHWKLIYGGFTKQCLFLGISFVLHYCMKHFTQIFL